MERFQIVVVVVVPSENAVCCCCVALCSRGVLSGELGVWVPLGSCRGSWDTGHRGSATMDRLWLCQGISELGGFVVVEHRNMPVAEFWLLDFLACSFVVCFLFLI